ncbi:MAG: hypothetical protein IKE31_12020, partial [Eubacterium sp.]|nr:hypothetical protein [Eubacterium sp.]
YNAETPCCNQNVLPVLLIMTSNAPDYGYQALLKNYQQTLNRFVGPTEVFVSGETLQLKDYCRQRRAEKRLEYGHIDRGSH